MSDEDVPFDDDLGSDVDEDPIDGLEDQEDFEDHLEPSWLLDDAVTSMIEALTSNSQARDEERATQSDQSAIEQIRVNKRLSGDQTLRRLLMKACQLGHKGVLDKLLELRVRTTGDFGNEFKEYTPLLLAIKACSSVEIVRTILNEDLTALQGTLPPLFLAVEEYVRASEENEPMDDIARRKELVEFLLEQPGIRLNASNKKRMTSVHMLCKYNHLEMLRTFLTAFSRQQQDSVSWMKVFNSPNRDGWTPFMFAVKENHIGVVEWLLSSCDPSDACEQLCAPQNRNRLNAISLAVQNGHLHLLKRMDHHITDQSVYSTPNKSGLTVLHYVCCSGSLEILEWLLEKSACKEIINSKSKKGYTPLLTACQYQKNTLVPRLLEAGADPTITTMEGLSCLHLAAMHDSKESAEIAKALLATDLNPMLTENKYGDTAYHTCCKQVNINVEDELKSHSKFESLKEIENNDKKKAEDYRDTEVIPAAIRRRGPVYVEQYRKALKEGKTTIKRLQLLVLGEERVGKTSLIRSLLGKEFMENCQPTQGIVMSDIGPEQLYEHITMGVPDDEDGAPWNRVKSSDYYESAVAKNLTAQTKKRVDWCDIALPEITPQSEEEMLDEIQRIEDHIREQVREENSPIRRSELVPGRRPPMRLEPQPRRNMPRVPPSDERTPNPNPLHARPRQPPPPTNPRPPPTNPTVTQSPTPRPRSSRPAPPPPPRSSISQGSARKIEKLSRTGKGKDPPLTFHTLDFAGQKLYRPMHHCFITQHAFYIVVFNLEDFVKWLHAKQEDNTVKNPMIEIKYWLNNVYAHSPAEQRNIFLVGTHSGSSLNGEQLSSDDLRKVHEVLEELITNEEDDRFLERIMYDKKSEHWYFPVENSKTEGSRQDSGIAALQNHITEQVEKVKLPIKEERPVSWLKFEERLLRERINREKNQPLSTTRGDLENWARQCGVPDPLLAIAFFHDTGVIIDQGLIPSAEDRRSLLVLLNPQWLAKIMTKLMRLEVGKSDKYDRRKMVQFKKTGTIPVDVLKQCWQELLGENPDVVFDSILSVLKAFFLLCPYPQPEDEPPLNLYLVPSALPAGTESAPLVNEGYMYKFYFEFPQYLPEEVYTHLVCLFLSLLRKTESPRKPTITSTSCKFFSILKYNWKVTLLAAKQQLEVQASWGPYTRPPPTETLWLFKDYLLSNVCCEEKGILGTLEYYGGPLVEKCEGCNQSSVFPFVKSQDKCRPTNSTVRCTLCVSWKVNINKFYGWKESDQETSTQPPPPPQSQAQLSITNIFEKGSTVNIEQKSVEVAPPPLAPVQTTNKCLPPVAEPHT